MRIAVVDITGRNAAQYNPSLCNNLGRVEKGNDVVLLSPTLYETAESFRWVKLLSLVPRAINSSQGIGKRTLRAVEVVLNYLFIIFYVFFRKPEAIHFQWLPFLEVMGGEQMVLKIIKLVSPKSHIFFTVHNLYPHDMNDGGKEKYEKRFKKVMPYIDGYMVHLGSSKAELSKSFSIAKDRIFLTYHGIYKAKGFVPVERTKVAEKVKIIMYGYQTKYKGADILIEALKLLPQSYLNKTESLIVGKSDMELFTQYKDQVAALNTTWINRFVSEDELYKAIGESDLILLPYRQITQSGVLLLALSYRKPILTSDLPSFKETLEGYPADYFFEPDNPKALRDMLRRYIDNEIDVKEQINIIERLNVKYSWENTAVSTLKAYQTIDVR